MDRLPCALYFRVSTREQHLENQRPEVERLVAARGFEVVAVYEDRESAYRRRPSFDRMMLDARKGRFKVLGLWSLDRLGRGLGCFDAFRELARLGVRVVSVREPWTEQEGPTLDLLAAISSWVAGFERERLRERTIAGLQRARRLGRKIGRPRVEIDLQRALALRARGFGLRRAAKLMGTSVTTLARVLRAHDALHGRGEPAGDDQADHPAAGSSDHEGVPLPVSGAAALTLGTSKAA